MVFNKTITSGQNVYRFHSTSDLKKNPLWNTLYLYVDYCMDKITRKICSIEILCTYIQRGTEIFKIWVGPGRLYFLRVGIGILDENFKSYYICSFRSHKCLSGFLGTPLPALMSENVVFWTPFPPLATWPNKSKKLWVRQLPARSGHRRGPGLQLSLPLSI